MGFFKNTTVRPSSVALFRPSSFASDSALIYRKEQRNQREIEGEAARQGGLNPFDYIFRAGRDLLRGWWRKDEVEANPRRDFTYETEQRLPSQETAWQGQTLTFAASFESVESQSLNGTDNLFAPKHTLGQSARKILTPKSIRKVCGKSVDPDIWFANKTFVQEGTYIRPRDEEDSKCENIFDASAKKLKQSVSGMSCLGKRRSADQDEEQEPPARYTKRQKGLEGHHGCRRSYVKSDAHTDYFPFNKPPYTTRPTSFAGPTVTNEQVFGTFAFSSPRTPPSLYYDPAVRLSSDPVYANSVVYPESHGHFDELDALSKSALGLNESDAYADDHDEELAELSLSALGKVLRSRRPRMNMLPPIPEEEGSIDERSVSGSITKKPWAVDEALTDLSRMRL